jgi:DNA-binding GntR family transcriptional regulator
MQKVDAARFVRKSIEPIVMADACKIITPIQLVDLERNVKIQRIYIESGDQKEFFKLDDEFHAAIYSIADKPDVWAWIQQIGINLNRFRMLSMQGREYNWPAVLGHHEQMLKLLEAHDSKGLKAVVNEHLNHINDFSDGVRDSYPEYVE